VCTWRVLQIQSHMHMHSYMHSHMFNISIDCIHFLLCRSLCQHYNYKRPTAKFPYSKVTQYGITMEGLPSGSSLKHLGKMLQEILSRKDQLKIQSACVHANYISMPQGYCNNQWSNHIWLLISTIKQQCWQHMAASSNAGRYVCICLSNLLLWNNVLSV